MSDNSPWIGAALDELLALTLDDGVRVGHEGAVPNDGLFRCTWANEHGSGWARITQKDDAIFEYQEAQDAENDAWEEVNKAMSAFELARAKTLSKRSYLHRINRIFGTED